METERPHRTRCNNGSSNSSGSASELFICFTSRHSASQISLYNSLSGSRRLRSSGSVKGGLASPMLGTTGARKRGCGFDNPEPSSPKVTCIGQVRVKTKKQHEKSEKKRVFSSNDNNNQRWVQHFPVTICEAFNCLFPCRSSCMAGKENNNNNEEERRNGELRGEVYGRWAVAVEDGERKGEGVEVAFGEENEDESEEERQRSRRRRHIFEGIEFDGIGVKEGTNEEGEGRGSICIPPPKNALLLMRCRSDPMKMAALANRFWEPLMPQDEEEAEEREPKGVEEEREGFVPESKEEDEERFELCGESVDVGEHAEETNTREDGEQAKHDDKTSQDSVESEGGKIGETERLNENIAVEALLAVSGSEVIPDSLQEEEIIGLFIQKIEDDIRLDVEGEQEQEREDFNGDEEDLTESQDSEQAEAEERESEIGKQEEEEHDDADEEKVEDDDEEETSLTHERSDRKKGEMHRENQENVALPDCLLLMMTCEPKLSLEVSRETWVRPTDFIRRLSQRMPPVNRSDGGDDLREDLQPHRSSCSFSAAAIVEPKQLIEDKTYAPFVLTRCKSEPIRSHSAKLAPEACFFWKNKKLEPHRPATVGFGAAGLGF